MAKLHPEEIKARLRMRYGSLAAFEARKGLPEGSVSETFRKGRPEVEKVICADLGLVPEEQWPERFMRAGRRLVSTVESRGTTRARGESRQKAEAV